MLTTDDGAPAVVQPAFAPGTVIAGRYRLESRLGSGGGGTVWRCFDEKLGATVAFKIVSDDVDVERWRREVAMARRIADRNVCRVHDLGETTGVRFVTMELVEGASLRSKCTPDLPADEARELVRQVVSGTAAIHAAGVVHRDLKPENIVVDASGRAVIVDFGLAKEPRVESGATMNLRAGGVSAAVTSTGMIVGTPRYMSPEQAVGDTVDARTDVFALGLIAHELLTGVVPKPQEGGGRRVGELAKWPAATAVVRRCLSLMPNDRFADARPLVAALAQRRRGGRSIGIVLAAAIVATLAVVGVQRFVTRDEVKAPPVRTPIAAKQDAVKVVQITSTDAWPMAAPMSVAITADGSRFAYTTAIGELRVRPLAGGEAKVWTLPAIERASDPTKTDPMLTVWAAGWYSDGSIAVVGMLRGGEWRLYRVREDGTNTLLHASTERFPVAIAGELTVIAKHGQALFSVLPNDQLQQLVTVGNGERVLSLAASPDGKQIASTRVPAAANEDLTIQVTTLGGATKVAWRGPHVVDDFLIWLDVHRIAFAVTDPATQKTRILAHDLRTGESTPRTDWTDDVVGIGSAAGGTVLVLRGAGAPSVQLGDKDGWPLQRLHDARTRADAIAGWTTDDRVVFALGEPGKEQIVRASIAQGLESWPKTTPGVERPDAVVDNDVIAHRLDGNEVVIERIDAAGTHVELQRVRATPLTRTFVRCAGERTAPCVLERVDDTQVSWTELDPLAGKLGKIVHRRPLRSHHHARSVALTPDGKYLAIVEGTNEVHLVSMADESLRTVQTRDAEAIESIAFASDSKLWAALVGHGGRQFALARYYWGEKTEKISTTGSSPLFDKQALMRSYARPTPSPDLTKVAVVVRELRLEITRIDGL